MARGNYAEGPDHVDRSLHRNWTHHKGRQLKASFLRKMHEYDRAEALIDESLAMDRFNMGCRFERYLLNCEKGDIRRAAEEKEQICFLMRNAVHTYLEYALDYAAAGLYEEAARWLDFLPGKEGQTYPMIVYALGYFAHQQGQEEKAAALYRKAETLSPDYYFPNRLEEILILEDAMRLNPEGARAPYYLGNFWYAARQYEQAVDCWNRSAALDGNFPTVLRNLALANYNKLGRPDEAVRLLEKAFALDSTDARILMELDQLYKKRRVPHRQRLDFLEQHRELVEQRDDLCVERITLYNQLGDYTTACHLLAERKFHPWEGGEGKVTGQFVFAHVEKAKQYLSGKQYEKALHELKLTETYPENLGEGKLINAEENDVYYWMGCAYEGMGDTQEARRCFEHATKGSAEPAIAFFYNDQ